MIKSFPALLATCAAGSEFGLHRAAQGWSPAQSFLAVISSQHCALHRRLHPLQRLLTRQFTKLSVFCWELFVETWELRLKCCERVADIGPPCPVIVVCSLLLSGCKPNITGSYIVSRHSIIPACNDNTTGNFPHPSSLFSCLLDCALSCRLPARCCISERIECSVNFKS